MQHAAFASGLQFFVRSIPEGKTLVFQANSSDTVESIHERIQRITGIPVSEQRLIYRGKQLQCDKSLAECAIQNDAELNLVGRMRSTGHPQAWQIIDDMISLVRRLCKGETVPSALETIRTTISKYLSMTPKDHGDLATGHLQIFMSSSAPAALCALYMSSIRGNKECAYGSIRHFVDSCKTQLPESLQSRCAPILREFCKLLRKPSSDDSLYLSCQRSLGSMLHLQAWHIIDDMISLVRRLCKGETVPSALETVRTSISEYLSMTPKDDGDPATRHLQIFMSSSAPAALCKLYKSPIRGNKECADGSIRHFVDSCKTQLPKSLRSRCAPILLEFCQLLRKSSSDDSLYLSCRSSLGSMLHLIKVTWKLEHTESVKRAISIQEIFPFVKELADRLSKDLELSLNSSARRGTGNDVRDFMMFLRPLRTAIAGHKGFKHPISLPLKKKPHDVLMCTEEVGLLHRIFEEMVGKMMNCLIGIEERLSAKGGGEIDVAYPGWCRYLTILKQLNAISKLYLGSEERFWTSLSMRKRALCMLVVRYAKRSDDHKWLLEHKDIMDFESRRHLVMMMFPEVKENFEEQHEMLIDRSQLLSESFEYVANAEAESLHGGISMEFKNEEATGPGVLREWFVLVCQAIFDEQKSLFVACPNDRTRFFPNEASTVEPLHLKYFNFSGRMIALALMHKVQVGIALDRVFFLQLGGYSISLEDIRDADPCVYKSCKQILEMDAEFVDSDALGLTFVREVEEFGLRRVVELCDGGNGVVVNSKNRNDYVDLLIKHRFVTSISQQVAHFAQGFGDILSDSSLQKFFFKSLELEDIDQMLRGSENDISVEDWKAHTEYNGYKASDPQIVWLWKIVGDMSPQQKRNILFFWTSVKYLPMEGFRGLASRLYIYKSTEPLSRLPSSRTCFSHLHLPPYASMAFMEQCLSIIAQEHIGCSFGAP